MLPNDVCQNQLDFNFEVLKILMLNFIKIFFSVHAFAASAFTGFQIIVYERDNQRISYAGGAFAVLCILTAAFGCIPPAVGAITWLDYLTILSSIKLAITIVKYCPQAYMNFK